MARAAAEWGFTFYLILVHVNRQSRVAGGCCAGQHCSRACRVRDGPLRKPAATQPMLPEIFFSPNKESPSVVNILSFLKF